MEQFKIVNGKIDSLKGSAVFIKLSNDAINKSYNKEFIKFRGLSAPSSLIVKGADILVKIQGKNILEVAINPKIEIKIYFGIFKSFNEKNQTVNVYTYLEEFEALSNQMYEKGKVVNSADIPRMINKPALIFLNSESVFEVRIIDEDCFYKFKVEAFEKSKENEENIIFMLMRDDTNAIYYIHRDHVFFKEPKNQSPSVNEIKKLKGEDVTVTILNKIIRAEINSVYTNEKKFNSLSLEHPEEEKHSELEKHSRSESFTYNSKHHNDLSINKSDQVGNNYASGYSAPSTEDYNQTQNHETVNNIEPIAFEKTKIHVERVFYENFNQCNLKWYIAHNQNKPNSYIIFIGLCEATLRFPQSGVCNILKKKLIKTMKALNHSGYEEYFNYLVTFENRNLGIESLYEYLGINYDFFAPYAQFLLNEIDLKKIAIEYNVCINLYLTENAELRKIVYKPKIPEEFYPLISLFFYNPTYYLLYPEQVMEYDGYNLDTMNIGPSKKSMALEWPLIYKKRPEYLKLLDGILELHKCIDEKHKSTKEFKASNKKIINAIEANKIQMNSWDIEEYENLKKQIRGTINK